MLNKVWLGLILIAFVACVLRALTGDASGFEQVISQMLAMSKTSVDIAIGLVGAMCFWLGMMNIAEKSGLVERLASGLTPLFHRLMPEVPRGHSAFGSITMNLSANVLGLDNAATPLGLKAMLDLQSLNTHKDTASNAQILFLVLNTSSVTLFPIMVFVYRAQQGAADPADVFLPILFATSASTLVGLLVVCLVQRIRLLDVVLLSYAGAVVAILLALMGYFSLLSVDALSQQSSILSNVLLFSFIACVLFVASLKQVNVYDAFIEGAKQGFQLCVSIIPFLLAMLVAIAAFRASGVLDFCLSLLRDFVVNFGGDTRFIDAMPTALMKPFSGSGARAMMIDTMNTYGADSFQGRLAAIFQGSTETTFYVLAVYFGSVGIRYTRHAIPCGLAADVAGICAAIAVCYWFYA